MPEELVPPTEERSAATTEERSAAPVPLDAATPPPAGDVEEVERLLGEVEAALSRIDDGTYGRCVTCGALIGDERLVTVPTATTCATCPPPAPA